MSAPRLPDASSSRRLGSRRGPFSIEGQVALVTGAAGGIGTAVVTEMAAAGASVHIADLSLAACQDLAARVGTLGCTATVSRLDVTDQSSCVAAASAAVARHGRLDVLVNCAGIMRRLDAASTTDGDWSAVLDVNLHGTFRMCRAVLPYLEASDHAAIVNLASVNGAVAVTDAAAYSVSKAGVLHLTRVLALEWARRGIRVNAVAPTIVDTAMTHDLQADADYMAAKLRAIPLGRMASAEDVAHAVAWLASPAAAMVTGSTIFVDGGYTIQ